MGAIIDISKPSRESVLAIPEAPLGVNLVERFTMTSYFCADILRNSRPGWVYLIHAEGTNRWKIGRSIQPIKRFETLKKQSPYPLKVFYVFYSLDAVRDEANLHWHFRHLRKHGEWFEEEQNEQILKWFSCEYVSDLNCEIAEKFSELEARLEIEGDLNQSNVTYFETVLTILLKNPVAFIKAVDTLENRLKEARVKNPENFHYRAFIDGFINGIEASVGGMLDE